MQHNGNVAVFLWLHWWLKCLVHHIKLEPAVFSPVSWVHQQWQTLLHENIALPQIRNSPEVRHPSSLNVFANGTILLLSLIWTSSIVYFYKALFNLVALEHHSLPVKGWIFIHLQLEKGETYLVGSNRISFALLKW